VVTENRWEEASALCPANGISEHQVEILSQLHEPFGAWKARPDLMSRISAWTGCLDGEVEGTDLLEDHQVDEDEDGTDRCALHTACFQFPPKYLHMNDYSIEYMVKNGVLHRLTVHEPV